MQHLFSVLPSCYTFTSARGVQKYKTTRHWHVFLLVECAANYYKTPILFIWREQLLNILNLLKYTHTVQSKPYNISWNPEISAFN